MIEFNSVVERDFLNRKQVQELIDAGVDMSDAKYFLFKRVSREYIGLKSECTFGNNAIPTYSIAELARKMHYIDDTITKNFIEWNKK